MNYKDAIVRRFAQFILANGLAFSNAKHFFLFIQRNSNCEGMQFPVLL